MRACVRAACTIKKWITLRQYPLYCNAISVEIKAVTVLSNATRGALTKRFSEASSNWHDMQEHCHVLSHPRKAFHTTDIARHLSWTILLLVRKADFNIRCISISIGTARDDHFRFILLTGGIRKKFASDGVPFML